MKGDLIAGQNGLYAIPHIVDYVVKTRYQFLLGRSAETAASEVFNDPVDIGRINRTCTHREVVPVDIRIRDLDMVGAAEITDDTPGEFPLGFAVQISQCIDAIERLERIRLIVGGIFTVRTGVIPHIHPPVGSVREFPGFAETLGIGRENSIPAIQLVKSLIQFFLLALTVCAIRFSDFLFVFDFDAVDGGKQVGNLSACYKVIRLHKFRCLKLENGQKKGCQ